MTWKIGEAASFACIVNCPVDPDAKTWSNSPEWAMVADPQGAASAQWTPGWTYPA